LLLVPDNSSCCPCTLYTGSQSSILLGICNSGARVRGKVPINIDLSSLLLVPITAAVACLCTLYTWVPIQYPVRDFATAGLGKVPINIDLSSLLLVPDNSSCCLPGCTLYTRVPIQYPVRDFATAGLGLGARSQSILTCQACCWSLITAAVACLGARFIGSQSSILLGICNKRGLGQGPNQY
jgi:hypothetical protein